MSKYNEGENLQKAHEFVKNDVALQELNKCLERMVSRMPMTFMVEEAEFRIPEKTEQADYKKVVEGMLKIIQDRQCELYGKFGISHYVSETYHWIDKSEFDFLKAIYPNVSTATIQRT